MTTLNAGCGCSTDCDIRLDLTRYSERYGKASSANILGDIQHLPFRDHVFSETKCIHVLEHVNDPKLAFQELKRVSDGVILIRVPIWHLYSLTLEALYLIGFFIFMPKIGSLWFCSQLKEVRRWKRRYGDHKWYIVFRNPKIIKVWGIPLESEKVFYVSSKQEP